MNHKYSTYCDQLFINNPQNSSATYFRDDYVKFKDMYKFNEATGFIKKFQDAFL